MPNHFHLLIYQIDAESMTQLLKSVSVAYGMYFNKKYDRIGPLFQQRYKAVLVSNDAQLLHISRYIHLNPNNYNDWKWSSLAYYIRGKHTDWLLPERILSLHNSSTAYQTFLDDYRGGENESSL